MQKDYVNEKKHYFEVKWLISSGIIASIFIGIWLTHRYFARNVDQPLEVDFVVAKKDTIEITASEIGIVEYGNQQILKSPNENATVEQVNAVEGSEIKAGESLILLRDRNAEEQKEQQIIENRKYQLNLELNRDKAAITQQIYRNQKIKIKKLENLIEFGAISQLAYLDEQNKLNTAKAELMNAIADVRKAKLDVEKGLSKLNAIEQRLKDRTIISPIDGIVLDIQVKDNDGIKTGTELLTIGDPNQEIVKLQLNTLNASKVKPEQIAYINIIGPEPKTFVGKVKSVSPQAKSSKEENSSNLSSQSLDEQTKVDAIISLNKPSKTIIPGTQVGVEIVTQQQNNVITLPSNVLQSDGENFFVWLVSNQSEAKKQSVTFGLEGLELVEIVSGLKEGEKIIIPRSDVTLTPGTSLKLNSNTRLEK